MDATANADRIAVLIDADNTSHRYAEALLDEIAKYGNPTIKRAYGDWSSPRLGGWTKELNARAIRGMHQTAFTTGKNSTDSALIIDAMDLLYAGNVEAFALVTSDSDFTSLALRLRESGKTVYGLGGKRTPASLQNACDKFIRLEVLGEEHAHEEEDDGEEADETADAPRLNLQSALTKAVNATADEDGWTSLGSIGSHLTRTHAAFDPRMFGHAKLSALVAEQPYLETTGQGNTSRIRLKGKQSARKAAAKAPAKAPEKTAEKAPEKAAEKTPRKAAEKAPEKAAAEAPAAQAADTPPAGEQAEKRVPEKQPTRKRASRKPAAQAQPSETEPTEQPGAQQPTDEQPPAPVEPATTPSTKPSTKPVVSKRTRTRSSAAIPPSNG